MKKVIKSKYIKTIMIRNMILAMITLTLQGIWEYVSCGTYYAIEAIDNMTFLMVQATIGDVAITLLIFNFLLLINKNIQWKMDVKDFVIIIFYAFAAASLFESRALLIDRWSYSSEMTYFIGSGIGLVPVLQLVILVPVTIYIENLLAFRRIDDIRLRS